MRVGFFRRYHTRAIYMLQLQIFHIEITLALYFYLINIRNKLRYSDFVDQNI